MLEDSHGIEKGRIIMDREIFKDLLEKYAYMSFRGKTRVYKDLNFIIHDKNNYTMPYKEPGQKRTVRKVIINYNTYQTIKSLLEQAD